MKESFGNLDTLKQLEQIYKNPFTIEQLIDEDLKNEDGENRKEVTLRMEKALKNILKENIGRRVAIISHGAAIKFLLMKWVKLNNENKLEFNNEIITTNSPGVIELIFEDDKLLNLKQIV